MKFRSDGHTKKNSLTHISSQHSDYFVKDELVIAEVLSAETQIGQLSAQGKHQYGMAQAEGLSRRVPATSTHPGQGPLIDTKCFNCEKTIKVHLFSIEIMHQ